MESAGQPRKRLPVMLTLTIIVIAYQEIPLPIAMAAIGDVLHVALHFLVVALLGQLIRQVVMDFSRGRRAVIESCRNLKNVFDALQERGRESGFDPGDRDKFHQA